MAELADVIAKLRTLGGVVEDVAPAAAEAVEKQVRADAVAGIDPVTRETWAPRKADGGRALADAASQIKVEQIGTRIEISVDGHYARHSQGYVKGGVKRRMIPQGNLSPELESAITEAVNEHIQELLDG